MRFHTFLLFFLLCGLCVSVLNPSSATEPWATYRGNAERTGNTDGKAGPASPKVLWVLKGKEHYVASPVPAGWTAEGATGVAPPGKRLGWEIRPVCMSWRKISPPLA